MEKTKKEKKKFEGIEIWNFLNKKIPAGTMLIPLIISAIITTISIHCGLGESLWEFMGNPMEDLFGKSGQMLLIGLMLFYTGTAITARDFVEVARRGVWPMLARFIPAYGISAIVMIFCGVNGFLGIDTITFTVCVTSVNAALYMGVIEPYGDTSDNGNFPILLILAMPLVPFIFLSSFGEGGGDMLSKIMQIFSLLIPFLLGVILGNLDPKIRKVFKSGNAVILPFLGFEFGSNIDLVDAFQGRVIIGALLLTVIFLAISIIIPAIVELFALKRPCYVTMGSSALAGTALSIPPMLDTYTFGTIAGADAAKDSIAMLAFVLLITNILCPFLTKWTMNYYFKHNQVMARKIFKDTHPELLEAVYDENGNYRTHHHNHQIFSHIFKIRSHKANNKNLDTNKNEINKNIQNKILTENHNA